MTGVILGVGWSLLALVAFALLLVLPGMSLARRLVAMSDLTTLWVAAVLISLLLNAALTAALLTVGVYDPRYVVAVTILVSVLSLPSLVRWLRAVPPPVAVVVGLSLLVAVAPWVASVWRLDFAPSNTLQWYYWDLGRALSTAGGIPGTVQEFGRAVPWLPDYVFFNGISEAYSVLMAPAGSAVAMQVWRVPLAAAGLVAMYLVARLWLDRLPAIVAVAAAGASVFFLMKFNAYKPESLGIVVGLLAAWLVVRGKRERNATWMALGGVALGVDVAIHAIAATITGLVLMAAAVAELVTVAEVRRRSLALLAGTAVITLSVAVGTGVALQGRPLVVTEVLRPAAGRPVDPTWTYLQYSNGNFAGQPPPSRSTRLAAGVRSPWPGIQLGWPRGLWLVWVAGMGILFAAVFGDRRIRAGLLAGVLGCAALAAGIAFFAVAFSTYVPQHTGLVRFAQYIPGGLGFAVGFAAQGYIVLWQRITGGLPSRGFASVVAAVSIACLVIVARESYRGDDGIPAQGREAIAELARHGEPGDVVLSNALTTGQLEFHTELEAPLEGRQPLIEEPAFLDHANAMLLAAHRFFGPERDPAVLQALGVRWVLVADQPRLLGASASLGGNVADADRDPRLTLRWQGAGVALFEVMTGAGDET
ncbi:MAG: hypothetical protein FIA92_04440 [Chloroflexi bacterium]|nr:hypothetical protein [Chloroflexota bacterium]